MGVIRGVTDDTRLCSVRASLSEAGRAVAIYLDNLAATPIDPRVADHHRAAMTAHAANAASSEHSAGAAAAGIEEEARGEIAAALGHEPSDVTLTPGASAALWLAIEDATFRAAGKRARIVASAAEHPALLASMSAAERSGRAEVTLVGVDATGAPHLDRIEAALLGGADLACFMAANNEIGTITNLEPILAAVRRAGVRLLVDASQAAGRIPLDQVALADLIVLSGAKMYGPRRSGALVGPISPSARLRALDLFGSPDPASASALAYALRLRLNERESDEPHIAKMRDLLEVELMRRVPKLRVNGDRGARLAGSLHVSTPHLPGEAAVARLWGRVAVSTGSACRSGVPGPSHVLSAMPLPDWVREGAIRIGLGRFTTEAEIEDAGTLIVEALGAPQATWRRA